MKYSQYPKYQTPPFEITGVREVPGRRRVRTGSFVLHDTGEASDATWWESTGVKMIDAKTFVKVYKPGQAVLEQLSYRGVLMFVEVMQRMKIHSDKVFLKQSEVVKKRKNLNGAGFYKGVCELLMFGVLAKSVEPNIYFVNTNMIFNGDRLKWQKKKTLENDLNSEKTS